MSKQTNKKRTEKNATVYSETIILIPLLEQTQDFTVILPKDPIKWCAEMRKAMKKSERIIMGIDTYPHGSINGCFIGFFPEIGGFTGSRLEGGEGFGIVVAKETLLAIKKVIDFACENFLG